jgi:hypothetical protein
MLDALRVLGRELNKVFITGTIILAIFVPLGIWKLIDLFLAR